MYALPLDVMHPYHLKGRIQFLFGGYGLWYTQGDIWRTFQYNADVTDPSVLFLVQCFSFYLFSLKSKHIHTSLFAPIPLNSHRIECVKIHFRLFFIASIFLFTELVAETSPVLNS